MQPPTTEPPLGDGGAGGGSIEPAAVGGAGGAGGVAGMGGAGGSGGATTTAGGCSDLFDDGALITYEVDIDPVEWAAIHSEFVNWQANDAAGLDLNPYHPITLRVGSESVSAWMRLKGNSSWFVAEQKNPNVKKQFVIAFDQGSDSKARFHGVQKVKLDMPSLDTSFLRERLAWSFLRDLGIPALCANSAVLVVNGATYGLYANLEYVNKDFLRRNFPGEADGDLWKKRSDLETNTADAHRDDSRHDALWSTRDIDELTALMDMDDSLRTWAAEALMPQPDGYWGGDSNFYVYDHPRLGFMWLADDLDATFEYNPVDMHPLYFWLKRVYQRTPGPQYVAVISDGAWRDRFVEHMEQELAGWDVDELQARVRRWSAQIGDALAADPNRSGTLAHDEKEQKTLIEYVSKRPAWVRTWISCYEHGGTDADKDGTPWCLDCNDAAPKVHPGATEICGDGVDQNCNGLIDDGCP